MPALFKLRHMKIRFLKRHGLFGKGAETEIPDGAGNYLVRVKVAELVQEKEEKQPSKEKKEIKTTKEKVESKTIPTAKKKK